MKQLLVTLSLAASVLGGGALLAEPAMAASGINSARSGASRVQTGGSQSRSVSQIIATVTNVLLFLIGAIAVIMIIAGGIRYTTSNGNAEQVTKAKNTIMYAVAGLIIAIVAYAIVDFVLDQL